MKGYGVLRFYIWVLKNEWVRLMKSYGRIIVTSIPLISKAMFLRFWRTTESSREFAKNTNATSQLVEV